MWGPKPKPRASAEYARIGDSPKNYVQKMLAFLSCERNSLWELKFFTGTSAPPPDTFWSWERGQVVVYGVGDACTTPVFLLH